jgi:hypothetical protein
VTAVAAITELERLLRSGDCPLPDWLASKYLVRCKSMVTELQRMADRWVADAVDGATRRVYDDAEAAVAAITDIERLLQSGDCPLPDQVTSKHLSRCKSMISELQRISDQWAAGAREKA